MARRLYELEYGSHPGIADELGERDYVPGWYLHGANDELLSLTAEPYCEAAPDDLAGARTWAEKIISGVTAYQVAGWDGLVPQLTEDRFELTFVTTTGSFYTFTVDGETSDAIMTRVRYESGGSVTLPDPSAEDPGATFDIRMSHIVGLRRKRLVVPVVKTVTEDSPTG